jgi:hypothetical protein
LRYGGLEFQYAEPFANGLVGDLEFRSWVLSQTKFGGVAQTATVLHKEMAAKRSAKAENWWRSHFSERCRCPGCSGQETDLLAIFEAPDRDRFALHFEVKQPTDHFPKGKDQAANYALRASCWVANPPAAILSHGDAATVLLCSQARLRGYGDQPRKFDSVITFERIAAEFPNWAPTPEAT